MDESTEIAEGRAPEHEEYLLEVDGTEYRWPEETITGAQLMQLANVPVAVGLVQVFDDGTQETISPDTIVDLKPGRRFKHRPRFKRG